MNCTGCGKELDRVDHVGTNRYILDNDVYRDLAIDDNMVYGGPGVASDTEVRCGYCGHPITREARVYFYKRWIRVLEITGKAHE